MKKRALILIAIIIVLLGSILANAQNEAQLAKKSWFDSFIGFFKSLFNKIFNISTGQPEALANNSINASEENQNNAGNVNENKNITIEITYNITCGYCQYESNNTCLNYSCCNDSECNIGNICENNKCIKDECFISFSGTIDKSREIPFETLQLETDWQYGLENVLTYESSYKRFGYAVVTNKSEWEKINPGNTLGLDFSDFENYFLIVVWARGSCGPVYPEIYNITQWGTEFVIEFLRKGECKDVGDSGWHIVKINRKDINPLEHLTFGFIETSIYKFRGYISTNIAPPRGEYPSSCNDYRIYRNSSYPKYYTCKIQGTDYYCNRGIYRETTPTCGNCQYLKNNTCFDYECCSDSGCGANETCSNNQCTSLNCTSCQYAENHKCVNYECCNNTDCETNKTCVYNSCINISHACASSCDDRANWTIDYCNETNGLCEHIKIVPYCGNLVCELDAGETNATCPSDCNGVLEALYCTKDSDCVPCCQEGSWDGEKTIWGARIPSGKCVNKNYNQENVPTLCDAHVCEREESCIACNKCVNNQCVTTDVGCPWG